MIKEQQLKYEANLEEILKQISESGKYIEQKENIELYYYAHKQDLNIKDNEVSSTKVIDKDKMNFLVGKYKDNYIGCLSIKNPESREIFGLNKYINDLFYIGQWNKNKKEGIGFLKIKENILYLGHFSNNQINGFGMLYYRDKGYFYYGTFIEGQMDKGLYYNKEKSLFYHGKFKDGKKNDDLGIYFDIQNKNIFFGEVKDDCFIRGYLSLCQINEEKKNDQIVTNFSCDKIIYFDKAEPTNVKYEYFLFFESDLSDLLQSIFISIFEVDITLKEINDSYVAFLETLENIVYNDSYTDYVERYNPEDDFNIENTFIKNYKVYYERFISCQKKIDIKKYENIIKGEPKINIQLKNEIK